MTKPKTKPNPNALVQMLIRVPQSVLVEMRRLNGPTIKDPSNNALATEFALLGVKCKREHSNGGDKTKSTD
jgi:hypothetical protein